MEIGSSAPANNTRAAKRRREERNNENCVQQVSKNDLSHQKMHRFEQVRVSLKRLTFSEIIELKSGVSGKTTKTQTQSSDASSFNVFDDSKRAKRPNKLQRIVLTQTQNVNAISSNIPDDFQLAVPPKKRKRTTTPKSSRHDSVSKAITSGKSSETSSSKELKNQLVDYTQVAITQTQKFEAFSLNVTDDCKRTTRSKNRLLADETTPKSRSLHEKKTQKPGTKKNNHKRISTQLQEFIDIGSPVNEFCLNEIVLATVPGYAPWPARIVKIVGETIFVEFFGTGQM